jgi:hypothetical protein
MAADPIDQNPIASLVLNGVHASATAVATKAVATAIAVTTPGTAAYTFTAPYAFALGNGQHAYYRAGQTIILTPAQKAALLAMSAPMTAA